MNRTLTLTLALLAALVAGAPVAGYAQTDAPGVDKRQHRQQQRIKGGVRSGELTPRETRRLLRAERHIAREQRRYAADGRLTPRERADLHRDLTRSSRQIRRQKHDDQRR